MATSPTGVPPLAPGEKPLPDKFESVPEIQKRYRKELDSLRAQLIDVPSDSHAVDDICLYRFLKGWKFDEVKAAQQMNLMLQFRKEHKLDGLRARAAAESQSDFPFYDKFTRAHPHNTHHGTDRMGQPLSLERIGYADLAQLCRTMKLSELMEYQYHHMENKAALAAKLTAESGTVFRMCKVMDLNGLGRKHLNKGGLAYLKTILQTTQANYPEMMGNLYIVNAPWVFGLIWKIVKPWLNEQTLAKITIVGTDYKTTLHKAVDPAHLPDWLGGTCKCGEGKGGCVVITHPDEGFTIVPVAARASIPVNVTVEEKDTVVEWEFRTRANDIGMQAEFTPKSTGKPISVLKHNKYNAHLETIANEYIVKEPGTVTLTFDNNHSYFSGKTLLYRIGQAKREEGEEEKKEEEQKTDEGVSSSLSSSSSSSSPTSSSSAPGASSSSSGSPSSAEAPSSPSPSP